MTPEQFKDFEKLMKSFLKYAAEYVEYNEKYYPAQVNSTAGDSGGDRPPLVPPKP